MDQQPDPIFDTSGMVEVLFDDIRHLSIHNGIFRCTLYSYRIVHGFTEPCWVPVQPVALPVSAVGPAAAKALAKVASESVRSVKEFVGGQVGMAMHH